MPLIMLLLVTAAAGAQTPEREADRSAEHRDKVICKRFVETGSLVRSYRTCRTKAEWDKAREDAQRSSITASCGLDGGNCR